VTWDSCADAPNLQITNLSYTVTANMAKYMVVDLSKGKDGPFPISYYEEVPSFPGVEAGKWDDWHKTTNLVLRLIQPGTYMQGWTDSTTTSTKREGYSHKATLTKPFYIAVFEMTQEQFLLINGTRGGSTFSGGRRALRPAIATYQDLRGKGWNGTINFPTTGSAVAPTSYLYHLREATGSDGFDLPTETEWEYACRCGGAASGFWNDGSDAGVPVTTKASTITNGVGSAVALETLGRYQHNGGMVKTWDADGQTNIYTAAAATSDESLGTAVVGSYRPNAWGLYDMHGNVEEWTNGSWPAPFQYSASAETVDDLGAFSDTWGQWGNRITRGGNCTSPAAYCAIHRRQRNGGLLTERSNAGIRLVWRFPTPARETAQE
jgi:formylglycine-generating enzyme required for sulfatase activity